MRSQALRFAFASRSFGHLPRILNNSFHIHNIKRCSSSLSTEPRPLIAPSHVLSLLNRLHAVSIEQESKLNTQRDYQPDRLVSGTIASASSSQTQFDDTFRDKFIALDQDKSIFVYNLLRAQNALNVVEAGTSFGVSTIYLALAVGQNARTAGVRPEAARVIATENEASKAVRARSYWEECGKGVQEWIELREGDLRETLKVDVPVLDAVLFDIWTPMALPTLKLLEPKFKPGTVLVVDNVDAGKDGYAEFYQHVADGPYTSITLRFAGGLGFVVYNGP